MKFKFFIGAILLTCMSAYGRLGESYNQCVGRYGQSIDSSTIDKGIEYRTFMVDDLKIEVGFIDDNAEVVKYRKASGFLNYLSSNEIQNLLKIEGGNWSYAGFDEWTNGFGDHAKSYGWEMIFSSAKALRLSAIESNKQEDQGQRDL